MILATTNSGEPLRADSEEVQLRLESVRAQLNEGTVAFSEVLREAEWTLALDQLVYWDHWVTPEQEERRFSARFFLTEIPPGFRPIHDSMETTDSGWFTPSAILERYEQDRLTLAPPTLRVLIELQEMGSMRAARAVMAERTVVLTSRRAPRRRGVLFASSRDKDYPGSESTGLHRAKMVNGRWELIRA